MSRRREATIGLDIGTTGLKGVLLDVEAGIVATASRPNRLASPVPGAAEADPAQWLGNSVEILEELATAGRELGLEVAGIATSGMVPALVAVDAAGHPVRPAMLQNDARAVREVAAAAAGLDPAEVLSTTGAAVSQQSIGPKARWVAEHEAEPWERVARLQGSYDWVLGALGARPHVEANWALESGLFRLDGEPYEPAFDAAALDPELVPPRAVPGQQVGGLDPAVARRVGLPDGVPLVVGGADHVLSAYGAGLRESGDWLIKLGGAGDILAISTEPVVDARMFLDEHPVAGLWLPNGCMATSGSLVRWVQQLLGIDDLRAMDAEADRRTAAEVLCLPYFLGEKTPLNDPELRGVFAGLHLGHDRVDLYRSALEGIAFGFRHNAEVLREMGVPLERATVTNGGATSLLWKRIHASVLGTSLATVRNHPGAALGAAVAAGVGVGVVPGWSAIGRFIEPGESVDPETELTERYDEAYALWRELGQASSATMRALARR